MPSPGNVGKCSEEHNSGFGIHKVARFSVQKIKKQNNPYTTITDYMLFRSFELLTTELKISAVFGSLTICKTIFLSESFLACP